MNQREIVSLIFFKINVYIMILAKIRVIYIRFLLNLQKIQYLLGNYLRS